MARYGVTVVQHRTAMIEVEADSPEQAIELANEEAYSFPDWDQTDPCYEADPNVDLLESDDE